LGSAYRLPLRRNERTDSNQSTIRESAKPTDKNFHLSDLLFLFEMPAVDTSASTATMSSKENKNSVKVLDELLAKLNISKAQEDVNAATHNLAIFINGDIESKDAPTK
jgi:hypothetical protein